jgi:hypothetical protein
MTASLLQRMELASCKFIGDAVAVYALFVLMLRHPCRMGFVEAPDLPVGAGRRHCR